MKAILTAMVVLGAAASAPAWAGEGAGYPTDGGTPPQTTTMTMTRGGMTDPFKWSAAPVQSQYSVVRGGNTDPYRWSASPIPAAPTRQATSIPARNPG